MMHLRVDWMRSLLVVIRDWQVATVGVATSWLALYRLTFIIRFVIRHVRSAMRCRRLSVLKKQRCCRIQMVDGGSRMARCEPAYARKYRAGKKGVTELQMLELAACDVHSQRRGTERTLSRLPHNESARRQIRRLCRCGHRPVAQSQSHRGPEYLERCFTIVNLPSTSSQYIEWRLGAQTGRAMLSPATILPTPR